jgi:hypothetical protein
VDEAHTYSLTPGFPRKSILKKNNSQNQGFSTLPAGRRLLNDFEIEETADGSAGYQVPTL